MWPLIKIGYCDDLMIWKMPRMYNVKQQNKQTKNQIFIYILVCIL